MKGKTWFKSAEAFKSFQEWFTVNVRIAYKELWEIRNKLPEENHIRNMINTFHTDYMYNYGNHADHEDMLKPLSALNTYITAVNTKYDLVDEIEGWSIIRYGEKKNTFFIPNGINYLEKEYEKDYTNIKLDELRKLALIEENSGVGLVIKSSTPAISVAEVKGAVAAKQQEMDRLMAQMEDIKDAKSGELSEVKKQIDEQMKKIEKMKADLQAKQDVLLAELNEKKAELALKMKEMQKQITILEDTIYIIRCFMGETVELIKIREGLPAKQDIPLVFNQKIRYLDEELAKLISIYDVDGEEYKIIEDLLKYNDTALEYFCPQPKCITFMKVSRNNKKFYQGVGSNLLEQYEFLHGTKIGFVVKNGDKVFVGWTEEDKVALSEDVFLKAGSSQTESASGSIDDGSYAITSYEEATSRYFAFAILQGLLENEELVDLPKPINIFAPSQYILFNYADNWLIEEKFGDFDTLVSRLNRRSRVGDTLLLVQRLYETDQKKYGGDRGRYGAEKNRTWDCRVPDGIHRLNLVDEKGYYYISAEKEKNYWKDTSARSNFRIEDDEFINITYWNSEWLRYYIVNRKIGRRYAGNQRVDFAYFVKYLKIALDYLKKRGAEEYNLIVAYYPNLGEVEDWQVLLSHWKLINEVRVITDFQAKRFAKYLGYGNVLFVKHLYDKQVNIDAPDLRSLFRPTRIKGTDNGYESSIPTVGDSEFGYGTPYYKQVLNEQSTEEEINSRFELDNRKLQKVSGMVKAFMGNYSYTLKDLADVYKDEYLKADNTKYTDFYRIVTFINPDLSYKTFDSRDTNLNQTIYDCFFGRMRYSDENINFHERFKKILYMNGLLEQVYPALIRAVYTLEVKKYESEVDSQPLSKYLKGDKEV